MVKTLQKVLPWVKIQNFQNPELLKNQIFNLQYQYKYQLFQA